LLSSSEVWQDGVSHPALDENSAYAYPEDQSFAEAAFDDASDYLGDETALAPDQTMQEHPERDPNPSEADQDQNGIGYLHEAPLDDVSGCQCAEVNAWRYHDILHALRHSERHQIEQNTKHEERYATLLKSTEDQSKLVSDLIVLVKTLGDSRRQQATTIINAIDSRFDKLAKDSEQGRNAIGQNVQRLNDILEKPTLARQVAEQSALAALSPAVSKITSALDFNPFAAVPPKTPRGSSGQDSTTSAFATPSLSRTSGRNASDTVHVTFDAAAPRGLLKDDDQDERRFLMQQPKTEEYPKYDGSPESDHRKWMLQVDHIKRARRVPDREVISKLPSILTGAALTWYMMHAGQLDRAEQELTWAQWKQLFVDNFANDDFFTFWLKERDAYSFPGSIASSDSSAAMTWIYHFYELCTAVNPSIRLEEFIGMTYSRVPLALKKSLRQTLYTSPATSFDTFFQAFIAMASDYKGTANAKQVTFERRNSRSGSFVPSVIRPRSDEDEKARPVADRGRSDYVSARPPYGRASETPGHLKPREQLSKQNIPSKGANCYKCGAEGHFARDCTFKFVAALAQTVEQYYSGILNRHEDGADEDDREGNDKHDDSHIADTMPLADDTHYETGYVGGLSFCDADYLSEDE
jgi:hypothetical protein